MNSIICWLLHPSLRFHLAVNDMCSSHLTELNYLAHRFLNKWSSLPFHTLSPWLFYTRIASHQIGFEIWEIFKNHKCCMRKLLILKTWANTHAVSAIVESMFKLYLSRQSKYCTENLPLGFLPSCLRTWTPQIWRWLPTRTPLTIHSRFCLWYPVRHGHPCKTRPEYNLVNNIWL